MAEQSHQPPSCETEMAQMRSSTLDAQGAPSTQTNQNTEQNTIYQVVKLKKPTQIRVLVLDSSKDDKADLGGTLKVVDLDSNEPHSSFTALSYCWGPKVTPSPWKLHCGSDMPGIDITENCQLALQHLRARDRTLEIWVDAICINQDDEVEKGRQVKIMDEIYGQAVSTFIWIGAGTDPSYRVMDSLAQAEKLNFLPFPTTQADLEPPGLWQQIGFALRLLPPYTTVSLPIQMWRKMQIDRTWKKHIEPPVPADFRHEDLAEFFGRPWFHRGWTFQESILPPQMVLVCGEKQLSWDAFIRGTAYLTASDNTTERKSREDWFPRPFQGYSRKSREHRRHEPVSIYDHMRPEETSLGAFWRWVPSQDGTLPLLVFENVKTIFQLWMALPRETDKKEEEGRQGRSYKTAQDAYYRIHEKLTPQTPRGIFAASVGAQLVVVLPLLIGFLAGVKASGARGAICALLVIILGVTVMLVPRYTPVRRTFDEGGGPPEQERQEKQNEERSIEAVVQFLRNRQVKQKKDWSYAMHGILNRLNIPLSDVAPYLNYGEVHRQLFIDLLHWNPAFLLLLMDAGLEIRAQPATPAVPETPARPDTPAPPDFPTWVPKLLSLRAGRTLSFEWYFHAHARNLSRLHAAPSSHPSAQIRAGGRQLAVKGIKTGSVIFLADTPEKIPSEAFPLSDVEAASRVLGPSLFLIASWILMAGGIAQSSGRVLGSDLIYLTLTEKYYRAEVRSELARAAPENRLEKEFTTFARLCMHLCSINTDVISGTRLDADEMRLRTGHVTEILIREEIQSNTAGRRRQDEDGDTMLNMFINMVNFLARDKLQLVVMADGTIGRAPRVSVTDEVAIVAGVPAPLALRFSADHQGMYQVVGPIFVYEWMDGSRFREDVLEDIVLV